MTEREICISYREAKKQNAQLQILAELNDVSRIEIIGILLRNGEKVSDGVIKQLYKRLDTLDAQISVREKEYSAIVKALNGDTEEE